MESPGFSMQNKLTCIRGQRGVTNHQLYKSGKPCFLIGQPLETELNTMKELDLKSPTIFNIICWVAGWIVL